MSPHGTRQGTDCPTCGGEPINLTTGNTYIVQNDFSAPGLGGGLSLTRTWNSMFPTSQLGFPTGMFGRNWTSNYEERIFLGDDNNSRLVSSVVSPAGTVLYEYNGDRLTKTTYLV